MNKNIDYLINKIKNSDEKDLITILNDKYDFPIFNLLYYANIEISKSILNLYKSKILDKSFFNPIHIIEYGMVTKLIDLYNDFDLYTYSIENKWITQLIIYHLPINKQIDFWNIIKTQDIMYNNKASNYILSMCYIDAFVKNPSDEIIEILLELIHMNKDLLYMPKITPIFNRLVLCECRMLINYSAEEFNQIKNDINPYYEKIFTKLLKIDSKIINIYDNYYQTPLYYAVMSNHIGMIDFLIKNGADINYNLYSGYSTSIVELFLYKDNKIKDQLLKYLDLINYDSYNSNRNTPVMIIFYNSDKFTYEFKKEFLKRSNKLYISNIDKSNILHLMLSNNFKDDITKYIDILIKKKLDWTQKDINNISPINLSLTNKDHNFEFIMSNILIPNYIYYLNKRISNKKINNNDETILNLIKNTNTSFKSLQININDINDTIAQKIVELINNSENNDEKKNNIILHEFDDSDYSLFTAFDYDLSIYTYCIIKNNNMCFIPWLDTSYEKSILSCKNYKCEKNKYCLNYDEINYCNERQIIDNQYKKYTNIYLDTTTIWSSKEIYNIPEELFHGIINSHKKFGKDIIFFNMKIKRIKSDGHSNIIIFNFKHKYCFRFDPYGNAEWDNMYEFDDIFRSTLKKYFKDFAYYTPNDYMPKLMFQGVSYENNMYFKKVGDPPGFCTAWCYWFLEHYLNYYKIISNKKKLNILITKLFEKITFEYPSFLNYIRDYANFLKRSSYKIMFKSGINKDIIGKILLTDNEITQVLSYINKKILDLT
jgi:hypothetical protein